MVIKYKSVKSRQINISSTKNSVTVLLGLPVAKPARLLVMLCKYFWVHGPRKQSISKEMNNDNDLK